MWRPSLTRVRRTKVKTVRRQPVEVVSLTNSLKCQQNLNLLIARRAEMGALRTQFRKGFLISFLVTGLLAGCGTHPIHSEAEMRRHAEEFVSGLEVEILEEDHQTLIIGWFDPGSPTSYINSMYELSNSPEEVKEKLRALYPAGDVWMEYRYGRWLGEAPLDIGLLTPEKSRDYTLSLLIQPKFRAKLRQGGDRLPGIVLLLICP